MSEKVTNSWVIPTAYISSCSLDDCIPKRKKEKRRNEKKVAKNIISSLDYRHKRLLEPHS
jgi:hypothetical protein